MADTVFVVILLSVNMLVLITTAAIFSVVEFTKINISKIYSYVIFQIIGLYD